jgi:endonuclease/exonuclease/phosphatase family metal-dependent hydrolase
MNLNLMLWNVENLFIFMDKYNGQDLSQMDEFTWQHLGSSLINNKPLKKVHNIAATINEYRPDIIMLVEVGGPEALNNLNQYFLNDCYQPLTLPSNSDRGIDLGFLINKKINLGTKLKSYCDRELDFQYPIEKKNKIKKNHYFSRDVLQLDLIQENKVVLSILLTHLKSKLDKLRIDPQGNLRREAELKKLVEIYLELKEHNPERPIIMAGDFNGFAQKNHLDFEFKALYEKTSLQDALELIGEIDPIKRYTHLHQSFNQLIVPNQIDYLFLEPNNRLKLKQAKIIHLVEDFLAQDPSELFKIKSSLPSDHFPYLVKLELLAK